MIAHNFIGYWSHLSRQAKHDLAETVGVSRVTLTKVAGGHSPPSDALVKRLVEADPDIKQTWFV
jgi:hypothetical protein